ncbi:MAG: phospho-N-acetylmuramoyl-pentapeptide-transferase, partial [Cyanobacteria bacterium P01_G01_bin.49]
MDAKFSPSTSFKKPSGNSLLILLTLLLCLLTLSFAQFFGQLESFSRLLLVPLGISAGISGLFGYFVVPLL